MDRILIVAGSVKDSAAIVNLLKSVFPDSNISMADTGLDAKNIIPKNDYDAVIINCPLPDEYGFEVAELVNDSSNANCVMLVKSDKADLVGKRVEELGIMVVPKPLDRKLFCHLLKFISSSRQRFLGLQAENLKLQKKLEEIKIIKRAKLALMQYLKFTEQQAHKYLEKQAMDLRCTKKEVALKIIKTYEN